MKRRGTLVIVALNAAALVGLVFVYPHLMVAPGALSAAHASLTTQCFACHAPFRGASADRCATCHAAADIGLRTTQGLPIVRVGAPGKRVPFHQELVSQDCVACHTDHEAPRLTHGPRTKFSHALLREASRAACERCHSAPADRVHLGIVAGCAKCHRAEGWKPATMDHEKLFSLRSPHDAPCATCHVGGDTRTYTCYGCHAHTPENVLAQHREERVAATADCVKCHRGGGEGEGDEREGRERH